MKVINIYNDSFIRNNTQKTNETRKLLLVVLPYIIKNAEKDTKKKTVRSFLAFPYGVLTIASYVKKNCTNKPIIEIIDLNIESSTSIEDNFEKKLREFKPDIVGFSMSYDISFKWLDSLSTLSKKIDPHVITVSGGPAVTTAYEEILDRAKKIDAVCYSEGELGLKNLIEANDPFLELNNSPWLTATTIQKLVGKPTAVYEDLDKVVDVNYKLVDVNAYSMREAFSPFTNYKAGARQFFMVTSRGCPFKCVFCAEPSFHGANMRNVDIDKAVNHVSRLVDEYGLNVLTI